MVGERIWLLDIEALDGLDNPVELKFASGDYTDPSGNYYDLRLRQPALFTSSAFTGEIISGGSRPAFGESVLVNTDGGLDYLADYAVDGRLSTLRLKDEFDNISLVLSGTVQSLSFDSNTVSVRLRDPQENLAQDHPQNEYLGNNILPDGLEGTANDIKGVSKLQCFGKVRNVEPYQVNTVQYIYEAHDLSSYPTVDVEVQAVYDRGILLTKHTHYTTLVDFLAANVPSGRYATYEGYIKLHAAPVGQITLDIDSDVVLLGDVFDLLATQANYTLNSSDKTFLNTFGEVGYLLRDKTPTSNIFDLLAQSIGGYWYFENDGSIRVKQLVSPSSPTLFFEDFQIISISRNSTGAGSNGIPIYKIIAKADKIETVQTDLAAGADDTLRARLQNEYREAIFESASVRTRHPLSIETEVVTAFRDLSDAQAQAQRLQELLGVRRDSVEVTLRLDETVTNSLMIGEVCNLTSYKLGYSSGKNFIITGYTLDARLSRATLELFG